jgi:hypothetical protein
MYKKTVRTNKKDMKKENDSCRAPTIAILLLFMTYSVLFGLLADISQNTTVYIEHVAVDGIRSM